MRIDRLELRNFKKYESLDLDLHPRFNLLVGENGAGKTSVLDALAVALNVWLAEPPDTSLAGSGRKLRSLDVRLVPSGPGNPNQFVQAGPTRVTAIGGILELSSARWSSVLPRSNGASRGEVGERIQKVYECVRTGGDPGILPVVAYYGAARIDPQKPFSIRTRRREDLDWTRRWVSFGDALNGWFDIARFHRWFLWEVLESARRGGVPRPGLEVVRRAVARCVPGAESLWYDGEQGEVVAEIEGRPQPFRNLSAGQRTMTAMAADIAIRMVIQNGFLVTEDVLSSPADSLPEVLSRTPGVVLIDELDLHLHPRWQRRVVGDLKSTFPQIQFVCASHSPQIVGEVPPDEIRVLHEDGSVTIPAQSFGLDANTVLESIMGADSRAEESARAIDEVEESIETGDLDEARTRLDRLRGVLHGETRDTARLEATINNLEAFADEID